VPLSGEPVYMNHGVAWSPRKGSVARDAVLALSEAGVRSDLGGANERTRP
jgi:hypothetical protein